MTNRTKQMRDAVFVLAAAGVAAELPRVADSKMPIFSIGSAVPPSEVPHHVPDQDFPTTPAVALAVATSSANTTMTSEVIKTYGNGAFKRR
jgi:hypothetical protein